MLRRTRAQIVADLEAQGLRFRTFSLVHDSRQAIEEWDWNQRDLPHIPFIHGGFRLVHGVVDDGLVSGIYVQRVLGVRLPFSVTFHHVDSGRSRVYAAGVGPLVVVIGADLEATPAGTRVSTVYSVGGTPWLRPLLPLAEGVLRRNYGRLTAEDERMRERRRQMRSWGYRFAIDREGASYERSLDLRRQNVIPPAGDAWTDSIRLGDDDGERLVGRDDHLGLRLVQRRATSTLRVYPRMCPHEGASLDACVERGGALVCPWHGRRVVPLATFDLSAAKPEARETTHHRLVLAHGTLDVAGR